MATHDHTAFDSAVHAGTPNFSGLECWKPIEGWPGYEVSDWGRVHSYWGKGTRSEGKGRRAIIGTPKLIGGYAWKSGHRMVRLFRDGSKESKFLGIHGLVLKAFVGPRPKGQFGCHIDGDPGNNRLENLRWGSRSDNAQDALRHGTHGQAILKEEDIPGIWERLVAREVATKIGRDFGVGGVAIGNIRSGTTWSHLTRLLPGWPLVSDDRHDADPVFCLSEFTETDEEIWKTLPADPAYRISNMGRFQSCRKMCGRGFDRKIIWKLTDEWRDLKGSINQDGYVQVCITRNGRSGTYLIHRMILETFACPRPKGMVACHVDGNPINNRASNLRWDTARSNALDRERHAGDPTLPAKAEDTSARS